MGTLHKIHEIRPDHSDHVYHFTKGRDPGNALRSILDDRRIRDVNHRGYICFTEAPLLALPDMFNLFAEYPEPLLAPFGVAIPKSQLFAAGGRPVIYGPENDLAKLDESIHWRFENYNESKDFAWLREWRIPSNEYHINPIDSYIVTKNKEWESSLAFETELVGSESFQMNNGYFGETYYVEYGKTWRSISIEDLPAIKSKSELTAHLDNQVLGAIRLLEFGDRDPGSYPTWR